MKKEMGRLHRALGSKETGDPTDLELCSRGDITQLREENRRHSSNIEHLKKVQCSFLALKSGQTYDKNSEMMDTKEEALK